MVGSTYNLTDVSNMFKISYGPLSENVYNSFNVTLGRVRKNFNFTGKKKEIPIPQSFTGGVGSGSLPRPNHPKVEDSIILSKKMYSVIEIDRETMKASADDKGSFVRATRHQVKKGVESWNRNMSRSIFNDGTGSVATAAVSPDLDAPQTGTVAFPWLVTLAATQKEADVEEQDYWHWTTDTGDTKLLEVQEYNPTTKVVSLVDVGGSSGIPTGVGSGAAIAGDIFYMQNSKDSDPSGLRGVLKAVAGDPDVYGVPVNRRWQAGAQPDSGGAGLTTDMLNQDLLDIERKSGKVPTMIVASYTQFKKLLNLSEDQKVYNLPARAENLRALISFRGIEVMTSRGPIPAFPERFVEDDTIYYLNDEEIEIHHRPDFGWFDEDGTVLLRKDGEDVYEARYGGYLETYMVPNFHGIRFGLAT